MGAVVQELLDNWGNGAITSLEPDVIPPDASPRAWNCELTSAGGDKAVIRKRKGILTLLDEPLDTTAVIGQFYFKPQEQGTFSSFHLIETDLGSLWSITGGVATEIDSTLEMEPFLPDFEQAKNLCFLVNGYDALKVVTDGDATQAFGIARPDSAPTAAAGAAGSMTGDFDVAISFYNSTTGHESSRSDSVTVTLASQKLDVTIPSAVDPQVDVIRVHIRKESLNAYFFRVASGTGYNATTGGWAESYGTVSFDLSDDTLNAFIILSPDTSENDPPPPGLRYLCWHQSRMFAADDTTLFYSKVDKPEAFDPDFYEPVNPNDGQIVTGLHSVGGILVIFKSHSIWGLYGDDPNSWYLRQLDPDIGCSAHTSIVSVEGKTYWWSDQGPFVWSEGQQPFPIGKELIRTTISMDELEVTEFPWVVAAVDKPNQRLIFSVPAAGDSRNSLLLPYSYRLGKWESTKWDPMDACSLASIEDSDGIQCISLGNYAGETFQVSQGDTDGVAGGTTSGSFVAASTSAASITDAGATFQTTLAERYVTVVDSNGVYKGRVRISSNTGTVLTLATSITGLTAASTYYYYVGGPDWQFDTFWGSFGAPWNKKRFEFLFLELNSASGTSISMDLGFDFNPNFGQTKTQSLTGADSTWDATVWTSASYGTMSRVAKRLRIGRTGRYWRLRLRNPAAEQPITLLKVQVQAEMLTSKS